MQSGLMDAKKGNQFYSVFFFLFLFEILITPRLTCYIFSRYIGPRAVENQFTTHQQVCLIKLIALNPKIYFPYTVRVYIKK